MRSRFIMRTKELFVSLFLLAVTGLLVPATGGAHEITFNFQGTLAASDPHALGNMLTDPVGPFPASAVTGSFAFESHTPDANPGSSTIGQYNGAIKALSVSVSTPIVEGAHQFDLDLSGASGRPVENSIVVNANPTPANQSYTVAASVQNVVPAGPIVDGDNYFAREFFLTLAKPSTGVFSSDVLSETPPDPALFSLYNLVNNPDGQFQIVFASSHGDHTLFGNLTSLTAAVVPVPAAVYLFGSGLIGLAGLARRKIRAMA